MVSFWIHFNISRSRDEDIVTLEAFFKENKINMATFLDLSNPFSYFHHSVV